MEALRPSLEGRGGWDVGVERCKVLRWREGKVGRWTEVWWREGRVAGARTTSGRCGGASACRKGPKSGDLGDLGEVK